MPDTKPRPPTAPREGPWRTPWSCTHDTGLPEDGFDYIGEDGFCEACGAQVAIMADEMLNPKVTWTPDVGGFTCVESSQRCKSCGHETHGTKNIGCEECGSQDVVICAMYGLKGN